MLKRCLVALLSFGISASAFAADFKTVVIVGQSDGIPEILKARLAESFSRAVQRGVNRALAKATYGTGSAFTKHEPPKPVHLIMTALQEIDAYMEEEVMATQAYENLRILQERGILRGRFTGGYLSEAIKATPNGYGDMTMEVMLVPKDTPVPPPPNHSLAEVAKQSALSSFVSLLDVVKLTGSPKDFDKGLEIYDQADALAIVDQSQAGDLYRAARRAYGQIVRDESKKFYPVYFRVIISAGTRATGIDITAIMKPDTIIMPLTPTAEIRAKQTWQEKVVGVTVMDYVPQTTWATQQDPSAMRVSFERTYGRKARPVVHIQFGRLGSDEIRTFLICQRDCASEFSNIGRYHPTISGQFRFEHIPKVNSTIAKAMNAVASKLGNRQTFRVLIQDVAVRVDEDRLVVLADKSAMTVGVGTGNTVQQLNKLNNVKIAGVDMNAFGLDVYSHLAPELANAFTIEANNSISLDNPATDATNTAIIRGVTPLVRIFY